MSDRAPVAPAAQDQDHLSLLRDLITINIDSAKGFEAAAATVSEPSLKVFLLRCSEERARFADELQGAMPPTSAVPQNGSVRGALHRCWLELRGAAYGGTAHSVLAEAARGEEAIKHCYERALSEMPDIPVTTDLVRAQYLRVREVHDRVHSISEATA